MALCPLPSCSLAAAEVDSVNLVVVLAVEKSYQTGCQETISTLSPEAREFRGIQPPPDIAESVADACRVSHGCVMRLPIGS